jgi:isochorismate pyruvate lyase
MTIDRLAEIRVQIDYIDEQIVKLIAERSIFVEEAAKYKNDLADVSASARVEEVITKVTKLADQSGLAAPIAEQVYRTMIRCFVDEETKVYKSLNQLQKET